MTYAMKDLSQFWYILADALEYGNEFLKLIHYQRHMNALSDTNLNAEPWAITQADFEKIAVIALKHFGLSLSNSKSSLIQTRLQKRMTALGLAHFSQYLVRLEGPEAEAERVELLSVLTTNVTSFFREAHHFDFLRENALDQLILIARRGGRVRIWSAGCSTGQEAFSMAMTVLDMCPEAVRLDIKILATDIDPFVIERAKTGQFTRTELKAVPPHYLGKYLQFEGDVGTMVQRVQKLIKFKVLNLIEPLPFRGPFDVILCRNVAIYFERETQELLWQKLTNVLNQNGFLFLGHSEHVSGMAARGLTKFGPTSYIRSKN